VYEALKVLQKMQLTRELRSIDTLKSNPQQCGLLCRRQQEVVRVGAAEGQD
jgi:hypothetical protein